MEDSNSICYYYLMIKDEISASDCYEIDIKEIETIKKLPVTKEFYGQLIYKERFAMC